MSKGVSLVESINELEDQEIAGINTKVSLECWYTTVITKVLLQKARTLLPRNQKKYTQLQINDVLSDLRSFIGSVVRTIGYYGSEHFFVDEKKYGEYKGMINEGLYNDDKMILDSEYIRNNSLKAAKIILEQNII